MSVSFKSSFAIGDRVLIDGCRDLVGRVTAYLWRSTGCQIEVSWIHNGTAQSAWIDDWRLTAAERAVPPP